MRILIRTCDDWIAVYRDGVSVWQGHSCDLVTGLRALGIAHEAEDVHDQIDYWTGSLPDGSDAFPDRLA